MKFNLKRKKGTGNAMKTLAAIIVDGRFVIYVLFLAAAVYCALSIGKVKVNSDLTAFLPSNTETRRGIDIMNDEFTTYASANVMLSNVTYDMALEAAGEIEELPSVFSVSFDDSEGHFVSSSALLTISFNGLSDDPQVEEDMDKIREIAEEYDNYIDTEVGEDFMADLASQMVMVMLVAVLVIVGVLLFTSKSYFEVVIFFIVFVFAGLLNMGTNFWLGEISSITNTVAVILQLALAIDYAIIFSHRYQDDAAVYPTAREALIASLSKAIPEISSSSLTTIAGLLALTFMQFRLGADMGIVLAKGIVCSLLTVFLLMPGLIMLFPRVLKRTAHKSLVPSINIWGRFLMKTKWVFVAIFALLLPVVIYCSGNVKYAFADSSITDIVYSESREASKKIDSTFKRDTTVVILVPSEDFEAEKAIIKEVLQNDKVKSVNGLANIEIEEGHVLTDEYTPRMFSELLGLDIEAARLVYEAYGLEHEEYQVIFGDTDNYSVPLIDVFLYMFDKIDQGVINLEEDQLESLNEMRDTLQWGISQLRGTDHNRIIVTAGVPVEGDESVALVDEIREIAQEYYEGDVLVVGEVTSARDLADSYNSDTLKINLITILFVFLIILFTFRSVIGAAVLVFVIQGSIWINFSFPYITNFSTCFVTYMIVSAIQMGATIDYAIVIMSHYLTLRKTMDKKDAMIKAVDESFATVFTSGAIMTMAGFLIAYRVSEVYVSHIGLAVGRGSLISIILVLTVLPQLIVLLDKPIAKTTFRFPKIRRKGAENEEN